MTFDIIVWFYATFEKPQFNWYQKNDTYFTDIQKWKDMERYILLNHL